MKRETKGIILALLAAVASGIAIPANKLFIVNLQPDVFTAVRAVVIGMVFFAIASLDARKRHAPFKKVSWKYLLAIAVIGGSVAFLLYFTGLKLTTAGRGAFLYHSVLTIGTVMLAAAFLNEKLGKKIGIALAIMVVGTVVLYVSQIPPSQLWANPNLGDLLVIAASLMWAVEYIISKKAINMGETNFVVSFARMFIGGIILVGVVIILGNISSLSGLSAQQWINIGISTVLLFADVLFMYWSMKYINISKSATLLLIAPVVSLICGSLVLGEPAPPMQIAGSAIILVGSYFVISERNGNRNKKA